MSTIAAALVELAIRIGRWLLHRVITRGAFLIGHYMLERTEVFRARLARAKTARRRRWLRGRIRRWTAAGEWLIAQAAALSDCIVDEADALLARARRLPIRGTCERLRAA